MFKKLLYGIAGYILLFCSTAKAQGTPPTTENPRLHCGLDSAYLASLGVVPDVPTIPTGFPPTAIENCGKFKIYYYDKAYHPGEGFDDVLVGATRRNTLCAVLTYIQSVFDFSNVPSGQFIRLRVDTSFTNSHHTLDRTVLSYGAPFYNTPVVTGSIVNGFVSDYLHSGTHTDPTSSGNFHGDIRMNFDSVLSQNRTLYYAGTNAVIPADFQNGLGYPNNCQIDLYSTLLHAVSHTLGFFNWRDVIHGGVWTAGVYSSLDTATWVSDGATYICTSDTATIYPYYPSIRTGTAYFLTNSKVPYRIIGGNSHFDATYLQHRYNEGDFSPYVLQWYYSEGDTTRTYTKEELRVAHDAMGLNFNSSSFASTSATAYYYNNKRPYCSKNYTPRWNFGVFDEYYYYDTVATNFTMVNNVGSSLVINIFSDTSLHDDDGDSIRVIPSSLVNYRGCGQGGNNHNLLTLSNGNKTITYTPRPNFYGRAQFGFSTTDGKEKGTYVLYTIDVAKGTNVSVAYGSNLVLNGDFEEGTEVKTIGAHELVDNSNYNIGGVKETGRVRMGVNFSDCSPYSNGTAVRNSYADCSQTTTLKYGFGVPFSSFPWAWADTMIAPATIYHDSYKKQGDRYETSFLTGLYNLGDSVRKCHTYLFECDLIKTRTPLKFILYPAYDTISLEFTDGSHLIKTFPDDVYSNVKMPKYLTNKITDTGWTHITIPFSYCSDTPSNVLKLAVNQFYKAFDPLLTYGYDFAFNVPFYLTDNISIKEQAFTASITDTLIMPCVRRLMAVPGTFNSCSGGFTYKWEILGTGKTIATTWVVDVSPKTNTSYVLTVSNGCTVAKDTVFVPGANCPCSTGSVFGDTVGFYTLKGVETAIPALPYYYVTGAVTLSNTTTIKSANVLIAPNASITVLDSVKLTLDSAHLFTCPTDTFMWQGIVLASSISRSARIEVKNNSMIEDAHYAIDAHNLKKPASGDIISSTNSVYNRNEVGISVAGSYTATTATNYPITIIGNVFTARAFNSSSFLGYPAKWPTSTALKATFTATNAKPAFVLSRDYIKSYCKSKNFSYIGVQMENVGTSFGTGVSYAGVVVGGGLSPDDRNIFDNHAYGLHSHNSNTSVFNSVFMNISKRMNIGSTEPSYGGMGIVAQSDDAYPNNMLLVSTSVAGGNLPNRFHDCYFGIYTHNLATMDLSYNIITSSHVSGSAVPGADVSTDVAGGFGIYNDGRPTQKSWQFNENRISNMNTGIYAYIANPPAGSTTLMKKNYMFAANPEIGTSMTTGQYMWRGIDVFSPSLSGSNALTITTNTMTKLYNGINLNNLKTTKAVVNLNIINLKDNRTSSSSPEQFAIQAVACADAQIISNTLSTDALGTFADPIRGVYASGNTGTLICGNTTNHIGRGFEFAGTTAQAGTIWTNNTMQDAYKGMMLGSAIGNQVQTYVTIWSGSYGTLIKYYNACGNHWSGTGWSSLRPQTYVTVDSRSSILFTRTGYSDENPTQNFSPVPALAYTTSGPSTKGFIIFSPTAPRSLDDANTGLYPCAAPVAGGGGSVSGAGTKGSSTSKMMLTAEILGDGTTGYDPMPRPNQWMAQFALWKAAKADSTATDSNLAFQSFMQHGTGTRYKWLTDIEAALAAGDSTTAQSLIGTTVAGTGRVVIDSGLVITDIADADYVVAHYIDYYTYYLNYIKGSAVDTPALFALSQLCPAIHSEVVYAARGLYQLLTRKAVDYYDDSCEFYTGYRVTPNGVEQTQEQVYNLYPNPNDGSFTITQRKAEQNAVHLKVYNALGAMVYQTNATFANGQLKVDMGQKAPGLYLVCVGDDKNRNICLRFTVK